MPQLTLPNNWLARPYQVNAWRALASGVKRAMFVWPRRHGKDDLSLHWTATEAMIRVGNYLHLLPIGKEARRAIWTAVNIHTGKRRIDEAFPREIIKRANDQEMFLEFVNGSTWQVGGSDNYMAFLGSGAAGVVFSEYAYGDPQAYASMRPMLLESKGWALFPSTPFGRNHFHGMYEYARTHPTEWFAEHLTYKQCNVFTDDEIAREQRELASELGDEEAEQQIAQWYMCSFDAAIRGAYFAKVIQQLEAKGRITTVPYDPRWPVFTAWDLGVGDSTAIWFVQNAPIGNAVHVIDYYENSGVGADHYARVLKERGYHYGGHYLPHDADDREWGSNATSRVETLKSMGVKPCKVLPRASVDDGINAGRLLLARCVFDAVACVRGLECLRNYRREWSEDKRVYTDKPLHDWTSHGADAWRYLAQGLRDTKDTSQPRPRFALT